MRILLLGEYSSYSKYLKDGLESLGYEVMLAASGDGWKNIPGSDYDLWKTSGSNILIQKMSRLISSIKRVDKFHDYDVVHLVNPLIYNCIINTKLIRTIKRNNKNVFSLAAVGNDMALINAYKRGVFDYYIDDFLHETPWTKKSWDGWLYRKSDKEVLKECDVIIPGLYEYYVGYIGDYRLHHVIPMPVNTDTIDYSENIVKDKVVFFHGLNRENAKGTPYIRQAFDIINKRYGGLVETVIDGHMPFDKYLEVINKTNVMVDQCCGYGYGINALISMAKGKVVMAGAHDKTLEAFGVKREECPVFHAKPDVSYLVSQMSYIIENKEKIPEWGYESRKYVEKLHDCKKVAQQYVDAWKSTGKL